MNSYDENSLSKKKEVAMQKEIGKNDGTIWDALNTRGEQSLSQLKKAVNGREAALEIPYPVRVVVGTPGCSGVGCRGTTSR
jgi:hypothetical protein